MTKYLHAEVAQRSETKGGSRMMETDTPSLAKQRKRGWASGGGGKSWAEGKKCTIWVICLADKNLSGDKSCHQGVAL